MQYYRLGLYVIFGILPSIAWLFYYLQKDLHPEPKRMILKVFIYGALSTIPVFLIEISLSWLLNKFQSFSPITFSPLFFNVVKWFIVIAFTEELLKYLVVKLAVFKSHELDEPLDIMLYMVVGALGFAALENILYLFSPLDTMTFSTIIKTTATVSFIRFIGATFLHTLCSALIGYFWAWSLLEPRKKKALLFVGIFLAVVSHGLYNFSIITLKAPFNFILPAALLGILAIIITSEFNKIKKWKDICIVEPISNFKIKLKSIKIRQ